LYYVYAHYTETTNELFYVGIGQGRRAYNYTSRNRYWKNIFNKYGCRVDILKEGLQKQDAVELEMVLQRLLTPRACLIYGEGTGKISAPKDRRNKSKKRAGYVMSQETKDKISKAKKGKYIGKWGGVNSPSYGLKRSQETKDKISKTKSKAVKNCRGELFESATIAAAYYNIGKSSVSASATGSRKTGGTYSDGTKITWRYI
jgi:hypothetical protein